MSGCRTVTAMDRAFGWFLKYVATTTRRFAISVVSPANGATRKQSARNSAGEPLRRYEWLESLSASWINSVWAVVFRFAPRRRPPRWRLGFAAGEGSDAVLFSCVADVEDGFAVTGGESSGTTELFPVVSVEGWSGGRARGFASGCMCNDVAK